MQLKSLRLYILFLLVALGLTGSCVLYKAENRAEENPLPGRFLVASCKQVVVSKRTQNARKLNHAEKLENLYDRPSSIKPEHVHEVKNNSSYHFVTSSVTSSNP